MNLSRIAHDERTSTAFMLGAAAIALVLANTQARNWYDNLSNFAVGPSALHLHLSLESWVTDGLLAVFFYIVGLELKHEMVTGSLRSIKTATLPVIAALGGVIGPAVIFLTLSNALHPEITHGWAIPTATDIAFVVAVFSLVGRGLPNGLRTFLLTLAVADDLIAICIIAIWYSGPLHWSMLLLTAIAIGVYWLLAKRRHPPTALLVVLGMIAWVALHASGIHATLAGVALGFATPARPLGEESTSRAVRWGNNLTLFSGLVVLPVFAFFATDVHLQASTAMFDGTFWIVSIALFVGKIIGIGGATLLATRVMQLRLPAQVRLKDVLAASPLTAIGFTIALLVASLSFHDQDHLASAKIGILVTSMFAGIVGTVTLSIWKRLRPPTALP